MSRLEVLKLYKSLHRTAQRAFLGDIPTLVAARDKVRKYPNWGTPDLQTPFDPRNCVLGAT